MVGGALYRSEDPFSKGMERDFALAAHSAIGFQKTKVGKLYYTDSEMVWESCNLFFIIAGYWVYSSFIFEKRSQ